MGKGPKGRSRGRRERSKQELAADLADISQQYLDGKTQRQIVVWIKENRGYTLSIGQVNADIKKAIALWMEKAVANIDEIKARDLAKLADIESRATAAYERSLKDFERTQQEQITAADGKAGKRIKASVTKETRDGDPRWLAVILDCIRERKEILGYAKPKKIDLGNLDEKPFQIKMDVATALEQAYGKPDVGQTGGGDKPAGSGVVAAVRAGSVPDWRKQVSA